MAVRAGGPAVGGDRPGAARRARAIPDGARAVPDGARATNVCIFDEGFIGKIDDGQHPAAAKVLATLDREWDGLARHREFPELALDNNTSERALRGPVVGRKNYYGSGSVVSAQLASRIFTITATATRAGLNPLGCLRAYLDECAQAGGSAPTGPALTRFLPWAVSTQDRTAWAPDPRPQPDTTKPDTDTNADPRDGPAPQSPTDRDRGPDHERPLQPA